MVLDTKGAELPDTGWVFTRTSPSFELEFSTAAGRPQIEWSGKKEGNIELRTVRGPNLEAALDLRRRDAGFLEAVDHEFGSPRRSRRSSSRTVSARMRDDTSRKRPLPVTPRLAWVSFCRPGSSRYSARASWAGCVERKAAAHA